MGSGFGSGMDEGWGDLLGKRWVVDAGWRESRNERGLERKGREGRGRKGGREGKRRERGVELLRFLDEEWNSHPPRGKKPLPTSSAAPAIPPFEGINLFETTHQ